MSNKKKKLVIGVNSGTSIDSLDIGLFDIINTGARFRIKLIKLTSFKYPGDLKNALWNLSTGEIDSIEQLLVVDRKFALFIGSKIRTFIRNHRLSSDRVVLIGSHGQTIAHYPDRKVTLQIGDPSIIASDTGITTVGDFRMADIGAGGEGAPLSPAVHRHIFGGIAPVAVLNIGGIANVSFIPPISSRRIPFGFDCGPGNILIDILVRKYFDKNFDRNGNIAKRGIVSKKTIEILMTDRFINALPPKSTGREYFGETFAHKYFSSRKNKEDIIATATEFSARAIADNIMNFLPEVKRVIISGGGALNEFLVERIRINLPGYKVETSEVFGLHPKAVECAGFALLAAMAIKGIKSDLSKTTGSKKPAVLGKVCYA